MRNSFSRRDLLKGAVASGATYLAGGRQELPAQGASVDRSHPGPASVILPLSNTSDILITPRGEGFFKFSFDFPEPSVVFDGLQISFRIYTFENTYALDAGRMEVGDVSDGVEITAQQLVWAGGQETSPGKLRARVRQSGPFIEITASAEMPQPIKSMSAIVRGVPRGKISAGGGGFFDARDNEVLLGYPFGGGSLFTARGMNSPIAVVENGDKDFFYLSSLCQQVRANRFYFQPGEKGYRTELIFEREGWRKENRIEGPVWRLGRADSSDQAYRLHFEHVEKTFRIPAWDVREDVPAWFREVCLVVAPHGMHWTGYIFNDFAKITKILEWVATQVPAKRVLVFLPAWDGRYYWNYPIYEPDPRLGGGEGFARLINRGHELGFHFMPMFGTNAANSRLPEFPKFADATMSQIDGDAFNLNWVDWDNDRHNEGWGPYMNIGVDSWREWLSGRIAKIIERYKVDSYFLDIAGGWENNTKADTHEGTCRLVAGLRQRFPQVMACGEMSYDALLACIPVYHVFSEYGYPAAFQKYSRAFQHLSHPAPGRGSSGVHESGFGRFNNETLGLNEHQIPTITIVDDTFERHRDVMAAIIFKAKQRAGI